MRQAVAYLAFNRGLISKLALARQDIKRIGMSAEIMVNWRPRVLGAMTLRPGLAYLGNTYQNTRARYLPFVFATDDVALVEMTPAIMRIWIQDALLSRVSVGSAVTNGTFNGNILNWTDGSDAGGAIAWAAGNLLTLTGNGTARAIAYQQIIVVAGDQGKEHALRIVVERGPLTLKVGSTLGNDDYVSETTIDDGTHSIAFTPTGNFYIQFQSTLARVVRLSNCTIELVGVVTLPTPYGASDLANIRIDQSADVIYIACSGFQQRKIERRGTRPNARGWSIVKYKTDDGPFGLVNTAPTTMTSSVLTGNGTLTASVPYFKTTHAGAIFELVSSGQNVSKSIAAQNTFSNSIEVTNVGEQRRFSVSVANITGTGTTATLQRSLDNQVTWSDVASYTTDQATTYADGLDNQIAFYRIGVKTGGYVAGTIAVSLNFTLGSITGRVRVTSYTSSTVVNIEVLQAVGSTSAMTNFSEGSWSDLRGWPTAVGFYEGRLCWAGKNGVWCSVSDAFTSYDEDTTGDSGPIARTVGAGPVDVINWILPMQRLLLGAQGAEISCRSSTLDEPLTPTNFNLKSASTQGSAAVEAIKVDNRGIFVQRGGTRIFELSFDPSSYAFDYTSNQLSALIPEIGQPGISRLGLQRQIDSIVHAVRTDGICADMLYDKVEQVNCWYTTQSDGASGTIEDVVILPASSTGVEDQVYFQTKRTVNGSTVRFLEKQALDSECTGSGQTCKLADAHIVFTNAPASATVTGLSHLVGQSVVVWADGKCLTDASGNIATFLVDGTGAITLTNAGLAYTATTGVAGLTYTAQWKSGKLTQLQGIGGENPMSAEMVITKLSVIAANLHAKGITYGRDFTNLDDLPGYEGANDPVASDDVRTSYDESPFALEGQWSQDERICLQAQAPRPATVIAAIAEVELAA
jgi:hypothetical protein